MATYQSTKISTGMPARANTGETEVSATVSITAAAANADILQLFKVPAGATILGFTHSCTDIDTAGSPGVTIDVGDSGDTDRLVAASTIGQAGGLKVDSMVAATGFLYQYTSEATIYATLASVGTGATGTYKAALRYSMNP